MDQYKWFESYSFKVISVRCIFASNIFVYHHKLLYFNGMLHIVFFVPCINTYHTQFWFVWFRHKTLPLTYNFIFYILFIIVSLLSLIKTSFIINPLPVCLLSSRDLYKRKNCSTINVPKNSYELIRCVYKINKNTRIL